MATETIKCEICGARAHAIFVHLKKTHPEVSLADYVAKYPKAELLSDLAKQKQAEAKASKASGVVPPPSAAAAVTYTNGVGPFSDLYRLGKNPLAKKRDGTDMMVRVLDRGREFDDLIPEYNKGYVYDIDILKSIQMGFEMNLPIFAYGHSGLGKSSIFKQICSATNRPYVRMQHTVETQYSHIVGQWVVKTAVDDNGNAVSFTEWQWGPLPMAMMNGWTYNADEFDRCPPSVSSVYQAILEGEPLFVPEAPPECRTIKPHADFRFVATGNTNGTGDAHGIYQATMQMDAASMERFTIVVEFTYMNENEEQALLTAATLISDDHANKVVKYSAMIRDRFPEDFDLTIGPRVMLNIAKLGISRGSFIKGVELAFANRLPADQRKSAMDAAQRVFGE